MKIVKHNILSKISHKIIPGKECFFVQSALQKSVFKKEWEVSRCTLPGPQTVQRVSKHGCTGSIVGSAAKQSHDTIQQQFNLERHFKQ